eukprot:CAMPEP_0198427134 /NCGR_PEP_ID=MMETSP1452-20131203/5713_1 /TAXON_ID=1181717 /ORGANISM="Synchroma pusillum, Strain CCMP3072" /LENGTH=198 /DNA_ID=CAMNT_0044147509 /DNA_START=223 /DNA_END=815 /DNA_ORIENTATION=+
MPAQGAAIATTACFPSLHSAELHRKVAPPAAHVSFALALPPFRVILERPPRAPRALRQAPGCGDAPLPPLSPPALFRAAARARPPPSAPPHAEPPSPTHRASAPPYACEHAPPTRARGGAAAMAAARAKSRIILFPSFCADGRGRAPQPGAVPQAAGGKAGGSGSSRAARARASRGSRSTRQRPGKASALRNLEPVAP